MQLGVIGLGRMGGNITRRLTGNGHECVVFDRDAKAVGVSFVGDPAILERIGADRAVSPA